MDPFSIAALISAGGGVLSSIFGGISESQNTARNNALSEQMLRESKLGSTDARGTRTYFKDGVGWVTEYGPTDRMLENYFLNVELPAMQDQFSRADLASRREDVTANALLNEFNRIERGNPAEIENLLLSAASRGIGKQTNDALETAMRSVMRSGSSHGGKIAEQINSGALEALANASIDSKLQALDYTNNKFSNERSNTANLYNAFADQARSTLSATTSPSASPTVQSVGSQSYQPTQADNGLANALGGIGASIGGAFNSLGASQQNNKTNALLEAFLTGGGGSSLASGGVLNTIAERTRTRGGAF